MEVIMRTNRVIIAASALLLVSGLIMPASASAEHRNRHLPRVVGHTYGYAPPTGYAPSRTPRPRGGVYDSLSDGPQSFPNPDRDFSGPNPNTYGG
jgi:hypothetical protein